ILLMRNLALSSRRVREAQTHPIVPEQLLLVELRCELRQIGGQRFTCFAQPRQFSRLSPRGVSSASCSALVRAWSASDWFNVFCNYLLCACSSRRCLVATPASATSRALSLFNWVISFCLTISVWFTWRSSACSY
ncbi:hypothetical protein, partial [Paraburkholderia sp. A1RO-1]|uniref:hypothetical protein n=1 Tax=Paraburkholderia sp. A1RO-1 TaxID=3028368 RepID=UPI003B7C0D34